MRDLFKTVSNSIQYHRTFILRISSFPKISESQDFFFFFAPPQLQCSHSLLRNKIRSTDLFRFLNEALNISEFKAASSSSPFQNDKILILSQCLRVNIRYIVGLLFNDFYHKRFDMRDENE